MYQPSVTLLTCVYISHKHSKEDLVFWSIIESFTLSLMREEGVGREIQIEPAVTEVIIVENNGMCMVNSNQKHHGRCYIEANVFSYIPHSTCRGVLQFNKLHWRGCCRSSHCKRMLCWDR